MLKSVWKLLAMARKKKETKDFESIFAQTNNEISAFMEKAIFNEAYTSDLGFLIDMVDSSSV